MAEKDPPKDPDGPSLELPSLGFGRLRRKPRDAAPPGPAATAAAPAPVAIAHDTEPETVSDEEPEPRRRPALPQLGAVPAALVTGLLVGVITVGLVWASLRLCELVRGTSSCGDAGFLLLVAVLVAAGLVGGLLLRALGVAEGGSISFLAMSLVAVALMLVLGDQLFAWWMILAVPAVAMAGYVLAQRITTAVVEPAGPEMHR